MRQDRKFISSEAWFSMVHPADRNEFKDGGGSFLFYDPNEWIGSSHISAYEGNAMYGKGTVKQELRENTSATPVKIGPVSCAYNKEVLEGEGVHYISHFWATGVDDTAFECSFMVREGESVTEAENIIASPEVCRANQERSAEIIPVRLSEIYQVNEVYEWASNTVKGCLKKDFQGQEEDIVNT